MGGKYGSDVCERSKWTFVLSIEYLAWIIGWDLILEYLLAAATVAVGWSGYVVHFIETVSSHKATQWIVHAPVSWNNTDEAFHATGKVLNLPAVAVVIALTVLLLFGIGESAKVNIVIVVIKILVVLLFIFACCGYTKRSNYTPFFPPNEGKIKCDCFQYRSFVWSRLFQ